MEAPAKIGVSLAVVGVLVGISTVSFTAFAGTRDSAQDVDHTVHETQSPASTEIDEAAVGDLPDSHVYVGDGIAIPKDGPGNCTQNSIISISGRDGDSVSGTLLGPDLVDMGATAFASGTPHIDEEGKIASYTVAAGDTLVGIGERFCIGYVTVGAYAHTYSSIDPGEVLILRPDPAVPFTYRTPRL